MIKVTGVTKHYDDFKVLSSASLHIRKGTIYGLIGPNGAGKNNYYQSYKRSDEAGKRQYNHCRRRGL